MSRFYVSGGGGMRIGGTFGAYYQGELQHKISWPSFDFYAGTSAGALDAAMTANGWNGMVKRDFFLKTDFAKFFTLPFIPFGFRSTLAIKWPLSLKKFSAFIDKDLMLTPMSGLLMNTIDMETNQTVIFCHNLPAWANLKDKRIRWEVDAFNRFGMGNCITRSMALPGLVADDIKWADGGFEYNPLLSILPQDSDILLMSLGYAGDADYGGDTTPRSTIDKAFYAFDFKAESYTRHWLSHFSNIKIIRPEVYKFKTTSFNYSREEKSAMFWEGATNSLPQWTSA